MRTWLNAILTLIGAESLTDEEYAAINVLGIEVNVYNQAAYDQLAAVLISRDAVSDSQERLVALFRVKGTIVTPAKTAKTEIFIGAVLE